MKELEQFYGSMKPVLQFLMAMAMGIVAHLDTIASILALAVLIFQLKVTYYTSKLKEMEYDKETREP